MISIAVFSGWYFSGLGFALVLLPRTYHCNAFLIAPLIGMCLLSVIGLFQMTVLLVPLYSVVNIVTLMIISLSICVWHRTSFLVAWREFRNTRLLLCIPPVLLLVVFCWIFHADGFELLAGGTDQLQYSANARQMAEEMNTGSLLDKPIPRQEYYVYEMNTRTLPYMKSYRRGAEVLLAGTATIVHISYENAFSVMVLNSLLTLGLTLGFLGRVFFRFSLLACFSLQIIFLSAFYLFVCYLQGSLALIVSIGPLLISLMWMVRVMSLSSFREWLFAFIVMSGYLSLYSEQAFISLFLPSVCLGLREIYCMKWRSFKGVSRLLLIYLAILCCFPFIIYSLFSNLFVNLDVIYQHILSLFSSSVEHGNEASMMQSWNLVPLIFGLYSYYDSSAFNYHIVQWIQKYISFIPITFYFICGCSLFGYYQLRNRIAYVFSIVLAAWMIAGTVFIFQQDILRFVRSLQYQMPFIIIGLFLLTLSYSRFMKWIGRGVLVIFIYFNVYSDIRTIRYILSHNLENDSILLHYNDQADSWRLLRDELNISALHNSPVLISGFKETLRPLAIAIDIRSQPQMLGESISHFWNIYADFKILMKQSFNTRFSPKEIQTIENREYVDWKILEPQLLKRTEQAVVPVGNDYPIEWESTRDIYPSMIKRFKNVCDVVYRKEYALYLSNKITTVLQKDSLGLFRVLSQSGSIIVHDKLSSPHHLILEYDGKVSDLQLRVGDTLYNGKKIDSKHSFKIIADVTPREASTLYLKVLRPVKLRTILWEPLPD
jgi:hypothetical protein